MRGFSQMFMKEKVMRLNTINEVAQRLAVSSPTVRRLIARAELPTVRVGRCLRLRDDDVEALIRRGYTGYQRSEDREDSLSTDHLPVEKENV
jgi:excisionase family DNA binding protein